MRKEISQRRFVETAGRILESEGMEAVTTRRIGKELHCNSANTYYYFKDLDELIVYAAMGIFTDYLRDISRCYQRAEHALDAFHKAWECLIERSVSMPQLYEKFCMESTATIWEKSVPRIIVYFRKSIICWNRRLRR